MATDTVCGATRDFGRDLGPDYEGKIVAHCQKPAGHDARGPHRSTGENGGGTVEWRGDDRS